MSISIDEIGQRIQAVKAQILERFGHDLVVTDRLKVLLAGTGAVVILSIFLGLSTFVDELQRSYTSAQINLERLKGQIEAGSWQERQSQSQILKSTLEERLWSAQTPGLAEAGFERWLRGHLTQHKLEPQQLQLRRVAMLAQTGANSEEDPLSGIQRITVKLVMPFNQAGLLGFLTGVSSGDKVLVVDRLIARTGRNARIEMDVSTFYRSQEDER